MTRHFLTVEMPNLGNFRLKPTDPEPRILRCESLIDPSAELAEDHFIAFGLSRRGNPVVLSNVSVRRKARKLYKRWGMGFDLEIGKAGVPA